MTNITNQYQKALKFFNDGDYLKSLDISKEILKTRKDPNVYNLIAIVYRSLGDFEKSIINFENALKFNKNNPSILFNYAISLGKIGSIEKAINILCDAISVEPNHAESTKWLIKYLSNTNYVTDRNIYSITHNRLRDLKFNIKELNDSSIKKIIKLCENIIPKNILDFDFTETEIYRYESNDMNCDRHFKIFNEYSIIPEFCFSCFKIQIKAKNILDHLKLFFFFENNLYLKKYVKKFIIEKRPKIPGSYKMYIYLKSVDEAEKIKNNLELLIKDNINNNFNIEIKRGCTEFGIKHPNYKEVKKKNLMNFVSSWKIFEEKLEKKFPELKKKLKSYQVFSGINLSDFLTIKNWLIYANFFKDKKCIEVTDRSYRSELFESFLKSQENFRKENFY